MTEQRSDSLMPIGDCSKKYANREHLFNRLHVYAYMRVWPELVAQSALNSRSYLVSVKQGSVAVHTHMHLYGYLVANAASAQVMRCSYFVGGKNYVENVLFGFGRERALKELIDARSEEFVGNPNDEYAHHYGSYRVENAP